MCIGQNDPLEQCRSSLLFLGLAGRGDPHSVVLTSVCFYFQLAPAGSVALSGTCSTSSVILWRAPMMNSLMHEVSTPVVFSPSFLWSGTAIKLIA